MAAGSPCPRFGLSKWVLTGVLLAFASAMLPVFQNSSVTSRGLDRQSLEAAKDALRAEMSLLEADVARLTSLERIARRAREIGLFPSGNAFYVTVTEAGTGSRKDPRGVSPQAFGAQLRARSVVAVALGGDPAAELNSRPVAGEGPAGGAPMAHQQATRTRRVWLPAAAFSLFALVVLARLVQLQVLDHERYAAQARSELLESDTLFARRGAILDRNGAVLAISVDTWDLYVAARVWREDGVARRGSEAIAEATGLDPAQLREDVRTSGLVDVLVARDVPYEAGRGLLDAGVPGLVALPNTERVYPGGDIAASIIGITGLDNTGLTGIEAWYDDVLQGTPGRVIFERDTIGSPIPYGSSSRPNRSPALTSSSPSIGASRRSPSARLPQRSRSTPRAADRSSSWTRAVVRFSRLRPHPACSTARSTSRTRRKPICCGTGPSPTFTSLAR